MAEKQKYTVHKTQFELSPASNEQGFAHRSHGCWRTPYPAARWNGGTERNSKKCWKGWRHKVRHT